MELLLAFGPPVIAALASIVAISGDTLDKSRGRLTKRGWIAVGLAVCGLGLGLASASSSFSAQRRQLRFVYGELAGNGYYAADGAMWSLRWEGYPKQPANAREYFLSDAKSVVRSCSEYDDVFSHYSSRILALDLSLAADFDKACRVARQATDSLAKPSPLSFNARLFLYETYTRLARLGVRLLSIPATQQAMTTSASSFINHTTG